MDVHNLLHDKGHKKPEPEFSYQVRDTNNAIFRKDIKDLEEAKMVCLKLIKDSEEILALPREKQIARNWALRHRQPSIWIVEAKPLIEDIGYPESTEPTEPHRESFRDKIRRKVNASPETN